ADAEVLPQAALGAGEGGGAGGGGEGGAGAAPASVLLGAVHRLWARRAPPWLPEAPMKARKIIWRGQMMGNLQVCGLLLALWAAYLPIVAAAPLPAVDRLQEAK